MKKFLLFTFSISTFLIHAQVSLVKDIFEGNGSGISTFTSNRFVIMNNKIIFSGQGYTNFVSDGFELWITDGTSAGTQQLNDIFTGNNNSDPNNFHYWPSLDKVLFTANVGTGEIRLFATDGTSSGLEIIGDPNSNMLYVGNFIEFNNKLFFSAEDTSTSVGLEPYSITTITSNGISLLKDLYPGSVGGGFFEPEIMNGNIFFRSWDITAGTELFVSDGTTAGTNIFKDIRSGGSSFPEKLISFNNKIYFVADDGINGRELWVTDGTTAGTQMVIDLYSGSTGSNPENLTVFNNALYFTATHPTLGTELFKMTTLEAVFNVKNIASGANSSNPSNLHVYNSALYFSADDGTNGIELWSTTGFSSTTNMLKNINTSPSSPDSNPKGFAEYNSKLYFSADDGSNGTELWVTDGTNGGTVMVDNINPSGNSNPTDLIVANNLLFFAADNGTTGNELWKYQDPSLSINNLELENSISLFPNPTSNLFFIETKYQINNISVFDIQGKTVKSFKENLAFYDIEDLTSGLYFVTIKTEQGKFTKKLIKE